MPVRYSVRNSRVKDAQVESKAAAFGPLPGGNHPFGVLLVDADGNVVVEGENTVVTGRDCTGHAETNVMRVATDSFDSEFLHHCTLYMAPGS